MSPRRRALSMAAVGAAALAGGVGVALWRSRPPADAVERLAPGFWALAFDRPDGPPLALAAYRGAPLVLNFWATWCAPCVREMPELDRFHARHRGQGWRVLGLAVDRAEPVRSFLARTPVGYDIALAGAPGLELGRALGNAAGGLPYTAVLDRDGRVRVRHVGEATAGDMQAWLAEAQAV